MRVGGSGGTGVYLRPRGLDSPSAAPVADPENRSVRLARLRHVDSLLLRSIDSLTSALGVLGTRSTGGTGPSAPAEVVSSHPLGLATQAVSVLRSTDEVNTTPTSYGPVQPAWSGPSTRRPTVSGTYTGTVDDTLEVKVASVSLLLGRAELTVRRDDGAGAVVGAITVRNSDPPGTRYTLADGLRVAFASGSFTTGDRFAVSVSASTPSAVDPSKPFDGTGAQRPGFEEGVTVVPGSFTVNGVGVAVASGDSIDTVMARINAAGAGVTASFDAAAERVVLRATQPGASDITVADDSSGFLAAVKLAGAVTERGYADHTGVPLADVPSIAPLTAGTASVGAETVAVDPAADSLAAVLARFTPEGSGARAVYRAGTDRVAVTALDPTATLRISDGSSGLFTALGITPGDHEPVVGGRVGLGTRRSEEAARSVFDVLDAVNGLYAAAREQGAPAYVSSLAEKLDKVFSSEAAGETLAALGVRFRAGDPSPLGWARRSVQDAASALRRGALHPGALAAGGTGGDKGLLDDLMPLLRASISVSDTLLGGGSTSARFVDTRL